MEGLLDGGSPIARRPLEPELSASLGPEPKEPSKLPYPPFFQEKNDGGSAGWREPYCPEAP